MILDSIASLTGDCLNQIIQLISFKEGNLTAILAKQQVLMSMIRRDECLAALRLMYTLDNVKFFEFFECTIDRDQTQRAVFFACRVEDFKRRDRARGFLDDIHHSAPRAREAISVFLQLGKPEFSSHRVSF